MSHIIDGECEIQPEKKREICVHFIEMSLFEGLESKFLQEKYYKDKLDIRMVGCTSAVKTSM